MRIYASNRDMNIQIEEVASHRNGVCGESFHVITFRWAEKGDEPRPMVAILFEGEGEGRCAVLDREMTRQGNITFAQGNSWRGDHFESDLRAAIAEYHKRVDLATAGEGFDMDAFRAAGKFGKRTPATEEIQ